MSFEEYLESKNISARDFRCSEPQKYASYARIFLQMHPKSFTMQKLFVLNRIRKKYAKISGLVLDA